jgi:hypothetical protein
MVATHSYYGNYRSNRTIGIQRDEQMIGEKLLKLLESVRKYQTSKEIWKDTGLSYDKFHSSMQELTRRKLVKRIAKATYVVDEEVVKKNMIPGRLYEEKREDPIPPFNYDLNKVPKPVQDWIWKNRKLPCSTIKKETGVSRFYIRQIIYERLSNYEKGRN